MQDFKQCQQCQGALEYITSTDGEKALVIFKCVNCDTVAKFEKPEHWVENGTQFRAEQARSNGSTTVHDLKPTEEVQQLVRDLANINPSDINEKYIATVTARVVLRTLAANLASKRPSVRQKAAETLSKIMWKNATTQLDVTTQGQMLQSLSAEELLTRASGVADRLREIAEADAGPK